MPRALHLWFERNSAALLNLKAHLYAPRITAATPIGMWRLPNRFDSERPMQRAVAARIIPSLRIALCRPKLHRELRYAATLALGRLSATDYATDLRELARHKHAPEELRNVGVMALALLRTDPGHPSSDRIDWWLDELRQDPAAPDSLRATARLLGAGCHPGTWTTATTDDARARILATVARHRAAGWLPVVLEVLNDPTTPPLALRAVIVAAGRLASEAPPNLQRRIVDRFRALVRDEKTDLDARVLACFALADAKTYASKLDLLDAAQSDSLPIRLAALLALHARRNDIPQEERLIIANLVRRLDGPADYRSMIGICRALHRDRTVARALIRRLDADPLAPLALGLLGDASTKVVDALQNVRDRIPNACIALAMLRQDDVSVRLLQRLKAASTFAEQSQALELIGRVGDYRSVDAVVDIAFDDRRPVALRVTAIHALARMGDLRRNSPFQREASIFIPGLEEPTIDAWVAQR